MKKILIIHFLISCLFVTGCSSMAVVEIVDTDKSHEVIEGRKYMSCDISFYQNGRYGEGKVYGPEYEKVANDSFIYSLMSSNAYDDGPQFKIPEWLRVKRYESGMGFGADVYESKINSDIAIAFRGTNFLTFTDWIFGNLNIFWKGQYGEAEDLVRSISDEYKNRKIITTGHSLGGGLAIHGSFHRANIDAVVFNASPRTFNSSEYKNNNNKRLVISEKGELLSAFRKNWPSLKNVDYEGPYNKFDFLNDLSVVEHGSYYIARGLTAVAASTGNPLAIRAMNINLGCNLGVDKISVMK